MGKNKSKPTVQKTTTTTAPDAASQGYINSLRQQAQGASNVALNNPGSFFTGPLTQTPGEMAQAFMNPYISNVVDATRGEFDFLRDQAHVGANQAATQAGAFGGSRQGVLEGTRLGALDRAQGSTIAGLLQGGYNNALTQGVDFAQYQNQLAQQQAMEPLFRQQQAQQFLNLGMGPTGQTSTSTSTTQQPNNRSALGGAAGGALTGASLGSIVPGIGTGIGAAIGGGLGLLGFL